MKSLVSAAKAAGSSAWMEFPARTSSLSRPKPPNAPAPTPPEMAFRERSRRVTELLPPWARQDGGDSMLFSLRST